MLIVSSFRKNAAFVPLAMDLDVSVTEASYTTTVAILFAGFTPLLYAPISNVYGRRPVYLVGTAIGTAANAGCAVCRSWGHLLVARAFVGIGTSVGMGVGASIVADLYFMHERGLYMGIYVVFVTNGAHLAAIIGGLVAESLGWRWCYWVPTITTGATWFLNIFFLPETLYRRDPSTGASYIRTKSWAQLLKFKGAPTTRKLRFGDFAHCFIMLKYPPVLLCMLYYSIAFGVGTVLFAVTGAAAFEGSYGFNTVQVGLAIGLPTTIGSMLGEFMAGSISDKTLRHANRLHDGAADIESRLQATLPGAVILPIGIVIEGVCLQYQTHWAGPVMGIGIAAFGLQIVSTPIFAYLTDCYKPQSTEISTLLNFGRLLFSFSLGFYMMPFAIKTTFGIAWGVLAAINLALFSGILLLMWKGPMWRRKLVSPDFDRDL
ncbi:hypothetical protein N7474_005760 [Penicillium riverlandense]|uniref:uncharacterized protein n=1 Tax=Penicillium riverlandense TaxID=1903569 RepID=UPI002547AF43|nr:uncharacterized protein N7474_005760 [Penicillium riverlandense]KAJ5820169.1 hypothetical protein N7474_005760 [Penicillium riverlandense]